MVDGSNTPTETSGQADAPKSAMDLRMEELSKRLDEIETGYKARIKELEEANSSLWAALHPAPASPSQGAAEGPTSAEKALMDALGLKEE